MRVRLVRRLIWVAAFGCLWLPVIESPPLHTAPFLQRVTTDSASVVTITAAPTRLRCEVRDGGGEIVAQAETAEPRRRHRLRLTGLAAGTEYTYEVREGEALRGGGRLATAPADDRAPVRFAMIGDSGGQPWWVWLQNAPIMHLPARWHWLPPRGRVSQIGDAMAASKPDFVLHLGDIVYPRGRHCHYSSAFFRPFADVLRDAPFYAALGNHDVMDTGGLQTIANLDLPVGDATGDPRCYSFAFGSVGVICLDCSNMFEVNGRFEPGHPGHDFLLRELASRSEPWIVVATHYPMRSASRQQDRADLLLYLEPVLEEHGVSLYVSGHDHCYQRFESSPGKPESLPLIVTGGGGKSVYDVMPMAVANGLGKGAVVLDPAYHWCAVEALPSALTVRATALDGREIDTLRIILPGAEGLARIRARNPERAARIESLR
ncbi:MAG: metallophosphoesterase [bacterium]|nr:metallophosphoesterase [bacterium]